MKCISIIQPWASLIVLGAKRFETRGWCTQHRGLLAIHASRRFPDPAREICRDEPFRSILQAGGIRNWFDLPAGAVLGTVRLVDCVPTKHAVLFSAQDRALGDFRRGRWAWELAQPTPLPQPIPMAGRLGVYDIRSQEAGAVRRSQESGGRKST